jgi:copper chaperone
MPTFTVNGMNCGHCTKTITNAILQLDPQAQVATDIPQKTVKVQSTIGSDQLKETIVDAGYDVTAVAE